MDDEICYLLTKFPLRFLFHLVVGSPSIRFYRKCIFNEPWHNWIEIETFRSIHIAFTRSVDGYGDAGQVNLIEWHFTDILVDFRLTWRWEEYT